MSIRVLFAPLRDASHQLYWMSGSVLGIRQGTGCHSTGMILAGFFPSAVRHSIALEDVNEAVSHASANAGPFKLTVLKP
jgi:hypothetical protein